MKFDIVTRLRNPPFGTETSERNIMFTAADEIERLRALNHRLKLEAETWSGEAKAHMATVHECYQIVSGGKGEPGNWNGARPIREAFASATARAEKLAALMKTVRPYISGALALPVGHPARDHVAAFDAALSPAPQQEGK